MAQIGRSESKTPVEGARRTHEARDWLRKLAEDQKILRNSNKDILKAYEHYAKKQFKKAAHIWLKYYDRKDMARACAEALKKEGQLADAAYIFKELGETAKAEECADACEKKGLLAEAAKIYDSIGNTKRAEKLRETAVVLRV